METGGSRSAVSDVRQRLTPWAPSPVRPVRSCNEPPSVTMRAAMPTELQELVYFCHVEARVTIILVHSRRALLVFCMRWPRQANPEICASRAIT